MDYKYGNEPAYAGGYGNPYNSQGSDRLPASGTKNQKSDNRQSKSPLRTHNFDPRAELLTDSPLILITPAAYKRQCVYIDLAPLEVGWMGSVELLQSGHFLIEDTYLIEQQVTSVETELSKDGIEKLSVELIETRADGVDLVNKMRFWGHSHVFMGTSPSPTDESTMTRLGAEGTGINWYIRGIFNKHGRAEFTLYLFDLGYRILDAPWAVYDPTTRKIVDVPKKKFFPSLPPLLGGKKSFAIDPVESKEEKATDKEAGLGNASDRPGKGAAGQSATKPAMSANDQQAGDAKKPTPEPERNLFEGFPETLTPSAALRAEIKAEYKQKVKERKMSFGGLFGTQYPTDVEEPQQADEQEQGTGRSGTDAEPIDNSVSGRGEEITDAFPFSGETSASAGAGQGSGEPLTKKLGRMIRDFFAPFDSE